MCRFQLDAGPGKVESNVEFNSTMDRYVLNLVRSTMLKYL